MTRFVARNGHRLSYATNGGGDVAVVGLHDLLADRGQLRHLAAALPEGQFRLMLPDARGHGAAPVIAGRQFPTAELVADLQTILEAEGIDRTHIVATGWSSSAALGFALHAPQRVASLVITGPYLPQLVTGHPAAAVREAIADHLAIIQEAAVAADKGLTDRALDLYLGLRVGSGWRQRLSKPRLGAIRRSAASLAPLLATLASERIDREALRDLSMPLALFVEPDAMPVIGWTADALTALLPQARFEQVPIPVSADLAYSPDWATQVVRALIAT